MKVLGAAAGQGPSDGKGIELGRHAAAPVISVHPSATSRGTGFTGFPQVSSSLPWCSRAAALRLRLHWNETNPLTYICAKTGSKERQRGWKMQVEDVFSS